MRGDLVSRVNFQMEAGEPIPPALQLWIWFLLPVVAILLIVVNQWLLRRRNSQRGSASP